MFILRWRDSRNGRLDDVPIPKRKKTNIVYLEFSAAHSVFRNPQTSEYILEVQGHIQTGRVGTTCQGGYYYNYNNMGTSAIVASNNSNRSRLRSL